MTRLAMTIITKEAIVPEVASGDVGGWIATASADPAAYGLSGFRAFMVSFTDMNWLHFEIILFAICMIAVIIISLMTTAPDYTKIKGLTFGSASKEQIAQVKASYSNWDIIHSLIIIAVVLAFYAYFW
jgi:hypothetical protein